MLSVNHNPNSLNSIFKMRKTILLLLYFFAIDANAQNNFQWADSGAVWHLAYTSFVGPGYQKIVYEKDTIIDNQFCQKMNRKSQILINVGGGNNTLSPVYDQTPYFLYKRNDSIFSYYQNSFHMAFKTNAVVGEIWDLGNYSGFANSIHAYVKVDSVYFQTYNGQSLRNIKIHHCDANGDYLDFNTTTDTIAYSGLLGYLSSGIINEKFGPMVGFNGIDHTSVNFIVDEYMPSTLSCYESATFPFIQFSSNDCFNNILAVINQQIKNEIQVFPNPANNEIIVSNTPINGKITLYNIHGQLMLNEPFYKTSVNISNLTNGLYLFVLYNEQGIEIKRGKLAKQ